MAAEKVINALTSLIEALGKLENAPAILDFLTWVLIASFVYFTISMLTDRFKKSQTERQLVEIDKTIKENIRALGSVTTALERLEK